MSKEIIETKANRNTQYQLYRTQILYPAYCINNDGTSIQDDVLISAYGIVAIIFIGLEQIYYDSAPLTAEECQIRPLFDQIYSSGLDNVQSNWSEHAKWCNPISRTANQTLKRKHNCHLH